MFLSWLFLLFFCDDGDAAITIIAQHVGHNVGDLLLQFGNELRGIIALLLNVAELFSQIPVSSQLVSSFS